MSLIIIHTDGLNCSANIAVSIAAEALEHVLTAARKDAPNLPQDRTGDGVRLQIRELQKLYSLLTLACNHERIKANQTA